MEMPDMMMDIHEKLEGNIVVAQIVEVGIEFAACIGVKIESYLQQLHQFEEDLFHVHRERVMAEAIVVKIKKTERAAGFEHGIKVSDNFKAFICLNWLPYCFKPAECMFNSG